MTYREGKKLNKIIDAFIGEGYLSAQIIDVNRHIVTVGLKGKEYDDYPDLPHDDQHRRILRIAKSRFCIIHINEYD